MDTDPTFNGFPAALLVSSVESSFPLAYNFSETNKCVSRVRRLVTKHSVTRYESSSSYIVAYLRLYCGKSLSRTDSKRLYSRSSAICRNCMVPVSDRP